MTNATVNESDTYTDELSFATDATVNDFDHLIPEEPSVIPATGNRIVLSCETQKKPFHNDWLFPLILIATATLSIGGGLLLNSVPPVKVAVAKTVRKIKTEFKFTENRKSVPPPQPVKPPEEKKIPEKPLDLTEEVNIVKEIPEEQLQDTPPPAEKRKKVRKVFGLRKVYSTGLGSGGSMSEAVVGKIGNTINKAYDTVTATTEDIKGTVVSTATVTSAPRFKKRVKPLYSQDMIDNNVQGTVKVKVLVDIDGKVKKATCMNDIGYDSVKQAIKATLSMEFDPAMRGEEPVAVWIIVPIRFVLLG